jgi:hypothetical protein
VRYITVPLWFTKAFVDQGADLHSAAFGVEFIRRKGEFDIVGAIDYGLYSAPDSNWRGNGKPLVDSDYLEFHGLGILGFNVTFLWRHAFNNWLSLALGAGLGIGVVTGSIKRISNRLAGASFNGNCTQDNESDINLCNPATKAEQSAWRADRKAWLAKNQCPEGQQSDDPASPCQFTESGVWPVVPIINLIIGLDFRINRHFTLRWDGGFRNAFFTGLAGYYFFK